MTEKTSEAPDHVENDFSKFYRKANASAGRNMIDHLDRNIDPLQNLRKEEPRKSVEAIGSQLPPTP